MLQLIAITSKINTKTEREGMSQFVGPISCQVYWFCFYHLYYTPASLSILSATSLTQSPAPQNLPFGKDTGHIINSSNIPPTYHLSLLQSIHT